MRSSLSPSASQQYVTDFFQSTAAYWKKVYSDDKLVPTIYQDRHCTALSWVQDLGLRPNARILEVGCGAGLLTVALARHGYMVDAVDSTDVMLQTTRKTAAHHCVEDRVRIQAADVHALPFQPGTFDLVIALGVIPWLHSERLALREMQRVLKPGGYLLVTADNNARLDRLLDPLSSPLAAPFRLAAKHFLRLCGLWSPAPGFQAKRHYPAEIDRAMRESGFDHVKSSTVGFGPFTFFGKPVFSDAAGVRLHRRLQTLASRPASSLLRWTGSHYLALTTKP